MYNLKRGTVNIYQADPIQTVRRQGSKRRRQSPQPDNMSTIHCYQHYSRCSPGRQGKHSILQRIILLSLKDAKISISLMKIAKNLLAGLFLKTCLATPESVSDLYVVEK